MLFNTNGTINMYSNSSEEGNPARFWQRVSNEIAKSIIMEGWLVKSRDHGIRFSPFKQQWVRRYFILRSTADGRAVLEEYRTENKKRLRKAFDLDRCLQIESHLQLTGSSCVTGGSNGYNFSWIFALHFRKKDSAKTTELHLVADSELEMNRWVSSLCRWCKLERQSDSDHRLPQNELSQLSLSSGQSFDSIREIAPVLPESARKPLMQPSRSSGSKEYGGSMQRTTSKTRSESTDNKYNWRNDSVDDGPLSSSASACSSINSVNRSGPEDGSSSLSQHSYSSTGPPVPPRPRNKAPPPPPPYITTNSMTLPTRRIALDVPIPATRHPIVVEQESSGETITLGEGYSSDYIKPSKVTGIPFSSGRSASSDRSLPPPVDRTKKPKHKPGMLNLSNARNTFDGGPKTNPVREKPFRGVSEDIPRSATNLSRRVLDYFEPGEINGLSNPESSSTTTTCSSTLGRRAVSSSTAGLEYIQIDANSTLALGKMRDRD